jgi:hypothetical protein
VAVPRCCRPRHPRPAVGVGQRASALRDLARCCVPRSGVGGYPARPRGLRHWPAGHSGNTGSCSPTDRPSSARRPSGIPTPGCSRSTAARRSRYTPLRASSATAPTRWSSGFTRTWATSAIAPWERYCGRHDRGREKPRQHGSATGGGASRERATGLEPATSSLGSWHSTTELRPLGAPVARRECDRPAGRCQACACDASRKLLRSGSLTAGSPGETLSSRPSRIHRSRSFTSSNRWSNESTMNSSGW